MKSKLINITWLEYKGEIKKKPYDNIHYKIAHCNSIGIEEYKKIYHNVGRNHGWFGRSNMSNQDLEKIIFNKKVEIYLMKKGTENYNYICIIFPFPFLG